MGGQALQHSQLGSFTRNLPHHTPQGTTGPFPANHWEKRAKESRDGCTLSEAGVMHWRCLPVSLAGKQWVG